MNKESLNKYTVRITQANRSELVVVIYDIILEDIEHAKSLYNEGEIEKFVDVVKHGQRFLLELMDTLDFSYEVSHELMRLYIYVNREMINAMIRKDVSLLDNAKMVMEKLHTAFVDVAKQDDSQPLMRNVQQVYAGLTYGKGTLNETAISGVDRGFKA